MRRALVALCGAAALAAAAQPVDYGERLRTVCAACHGPQGVSAMALTPSLAGQPSFYAITQLFLFRDGRRDSAAMTAVAKGMTDDDLRGYSEAIASLPAPPAPATPGDPARVERGKALAQQRHCTGCHGADLAGGQQVPRLAHQREDYLRHALAGFRAGTRLGYTNAMGEALAGLTPQDLDDLAHYMAHRP
jgi:cytochrome c553